MSSVMYDVEQNCTYECTHNCVLKDFMYRILLKSSDDTTSRRSLSSISGRVIQTTLKVDVKAFRLGSQHCGVSITPGSSVS